MTVLGETVVVAGLNSVQAFSADGGPLWRTALAYIPYDSETDDGDSRYYTRAEVVAEGDRIYVGRSSQRSLVMSGSDMQRLELSALDGGGTEVWTKTLGDEQNFVYDAHLSVYSSDHLRNSLVVAGTSLPQLDNVGLAPNSFVSVFSPFGEKDEAQTASVDGTIYGVAAPRSDDGITYLVGVIGDPSFNYDTPEGAVQDAFLLYGPTSYKEIKN